MKIINPNDLSFNNLDDEVAREYLINNGYFHNPFDLPNNIELTNPYSGRVTDKNGKNINVGDKTIIMRNPFNSKIISKLEYKDGVPFRNWEVNDNNEWVESGILEILENYNNENT